MGAISKLIKAGAKKAGLIKEVEVKVYDPKSMAQMQGDLAQAKEMLAKGSSRPDHHKNIIKKLEAAIKKQSTSRKPRTTFGGKKRKMATKKKARKRKTPVSQAVKKDYSKQELLKAGNK